MGITRGSRLLLSGKEGWTTSVDVSFDGSELEIGLTSLGELGQLIRYNLTERYWVASGSGGEAV
jgi:hypothetical protein